MKASLAQEHYNALESIYLFVGEDDREKRLECGIKQKGI